MLRCDRDIPQGIKDKISLMCDVEVEAVITCKDAPSIYDIPRVINSEGLDDFVVARLNLQAGEVDWTAWDALLERVHNPAHQIELALVGKYVDLPDAYLSITEAIRAGGFANNCRVVIRWVPADLCETPEGAQDVLSGVDAVLVPGGFGVRGIEGKIGALRWAREGNIPTLGICLGLQAMVMEYARSVLGLKGASSSEFDPDTQYPVVATMAEQQLIVDGYGDMGGTMRLGAYDAVLNPGSVTAQTYGTTEVSERHRHRYEVNNAYRDQLKEGGLVFSGTSPDGKLVEFVELPQSVHPYYVSTQAHPEFKSRPTKAHPLFTGLVKAALEAQT